jgi:EAL domain-containing protein (putative c-di-GMP-specific phosphodiesterase class I)
MGVEAFIRWQHPEHRFLTPYQFLPQIDPADLINSLFTLVLNEATKQWRVWSKQCLMISIALNVTARDLMNLDLANEIKQVLI